MKLKKIFALFGRLFISTLFILSALNKIFLWQETQSGLINLFSDWQGYMGFSVSIAKFFSKAIAFVPEILILVTALELIGALMIFFNIKVRVGAILLILFMLPATIMLHPFWFVNKARQVAEMILFLKNLAIIGGLFYIISFGSKQIDIDQKDEDEEDGHPNIEKKNFEG
jgi:putative oxidoreductase